MLIFLLTGLLLFSQIQPITIVTPNGGENWAVGSTQTISWTTTQLAGNVMIQLHRSTTSGGFITIAQNVPVSNLNFTWTIPTTISAGNDYKVRITLLTNTNPTFTVFDESDGFFSIINNNPPSPSITVTSPNSGEIWQTGSTYSITWTYTNLTGNAIILLSSGLNTTPVMTIAAEVPISAGSYSWTIPATIPVGTNYYLGLVWLTPLAVYIADFSDAPFTITNNTNTPSITVTSPNGGENWFIGNTYPITWNYTNLTGNVRIELLSPLMNPISNIVCEAPVENGVFNWTIPATEIPASFYRIAITWITDLTVYIGDVSDANFTISEGNIPSITVVSPNGGEIWRRGQSRYIRWTSISPSLTGNVEIALFNRLSTSAAPMIITPSTPNTGSFLWTIPHNIRNSRFYKVRIRMLDNIGAYDFSDNYFAIINHFAISIISNVKSGNKLAFRIEAERTDPVSISVYNIKGQVIKHLITGEVINRERTIYWDGRNEDSRQAKKGIYFVRMQSGKENITREFLLK